MEQDNNNTYPPLQLQSPRMESPLSNNGFGITSPFGNRKEAFTSHHLLTDQQVLELGVRESDVELYRRKHYQAQFGIDTWYDRLHQHTFRTELLPLHYDEAVALTMAHSDKELTDEQMNTLVELEKRIDDLAHREFPRGYFIKLNTRSPKDVPVYDYDNEKIQRKIIEEIEKYDPNDRNENTETIAFIKATNKAMKLINGKQAIDMLIKSTRISEDLNKMLQFGSHLFESKLILREWIDEVANKPEMEFRAFVHKNSLNAITQYFCFTLFPELVQNKEIVLQRIVDFFEKEVKDPLQTHKSYVIDFFVAEDRVMIIELNPFHNGAGACLFSWKFNRDLFMNGPLEFRILEKLTENPKETLPPKWLRFIDAKFGHTSSTHEDDDDDDDDEEVKKEKMHFVWWPWTVTVVVLGGLFVYKRYVSK